MEAWGETWPWHVVVINANGIEETLWRCNTRTQAKEYADAIIDGIMNGTSEVQAAWVMEKK